MAVRLPDGTTIAIASSYGPTKTIEAITNADPAVATLGSSHAVLTGDVLEVTSGWPKLNGRIVKAGTVAGNDVPLLGINTSSTARYPIGAGTGSIREIASWQTISQIVESSSQGGDQQFVNYSFLDSDDEFQIPSTRTPQSLQFRIADDDTLPHYTILQEANEDRQPRALRATLPNGAVIFYNAYITLNETPTLTKGQIMTVQVTASLLALPTRYAAS